jgi:pimeloyl-ACP methyl ester carboxylesterase
MTDCEYVSMLKSTIVRSQKTPWFLPLVRAGNRGLSALAPELAGRRAERMFLTPPRPRRPSAERALIASAHARTVPAGDGAYVETWTWSKGPRVLLVHGWGGRGAQLGAFVEPLVARGFSVVAFDAPGHGESDTGLVTIPQMVAAVGAVAALSGPLSGLIAHSVGGVVAARAMFEGLETRSAVFIGPAADLVNPAVHFTDMLGFSRRVGRLMHERIARRIAMPWSAFSVSELAPALKARLLVIHDSGDDEVSWQHGRAIAHDWPGAQLLTTDGLGHRRILRDPDVVNAAAAFITAASEEGRVPDIAAGRERRAPLRAPL